ncbi:MAG: response regulator transcription factor [Dehalococcoidia bacterium]
MGTRTQAEQQQGGAARPILVVEDDPATVYLVRLYLERDGHEVIEALDGTEGLRLARSVEPRLVVLDVMLPGLDGMEICRALRDEDHSDVPIIMLTARVEESDRLIGLDCGADDYVTKPFSPRELAARVRAVLRRTRPAASEDDGAVELLTFGEIALDPGSGLATVAGASLPLTTTEFKLLKHMLQNTGRVLSRDSIIQHVLGFDFDGMDRTVDTHVSNLRRKLEAGSKTDARYIHTVYGMGYRFGDA